MLADRQAIVTAGAYVWSGDLLPFVMGPNKAGDRLAVVRLGGHREGDETAWQCAAREVQEEAAVTIFPVQPPATYWLRFGEAVTSLRSGPWLAESTAEAAPVLVVEDNRLPRTTLSIMFLARTDQPPVPSAETRGLLLLRAQDVPRVAAGDLTLQAYLDMGGQAMLRQPLSSDLLLEPFLQLRVLAEIFRRHPEMSINGSPIDP